MLVMEDPLITETMAKGGLALLVQKEYAEMEEKKAHDGRVPGSQIPWCITDLSVPWPINGSYEEKAWTVLAVGRAAAEDLRLMGYLPSQMNILTSYVNDQLTVQMRPLGPLPTQARL